MINVVTSIIVVILTLFIFSCTSPSIVMPMDRGIYTLSKSAPTGFTPLGTIRTAAYKEINELASKKGKVAQIITVNEVPAGFGRWPQVEVRFKLVTKEELSNKTIPTTQKSTSTVYDARGNPIDTETTTTNNQDINVYKHLEKLGKLKEDGILTEEEFEIEKKKLLNSR